MASPTDPLVAETWLTVHVSPERALISAWVAPSREEVWTTTPWDTTVPFTWRNGRPAASRSSTVTAAARALVTPGLWARAGRAIAATATRAAKLRAAARAGRVRVFVMAISTSLGWGSSHPPHPVVLVPGEPSTSAPTAATSRREPPPPAS